MVSERAFVATCIACILLIVAFALMMDAT